MEIDVPLSATSRRILTKFFTKTKSWSWAKSLYVYGYRDQVRGDFAIDRQQTAKERSRERAAKFHARKLEAQRELEAHVSGLEQEVIRLREALNERN